MNSVLPSVFETRYGRKIPLVQGYRDFYPASYWDTPERRAESEAPQRPFHLFQNHVYKLSIILDFLQELGQRSNWTRALDVGAMDATVSRLLTASGRVVQAHAADLYDQSDRLSDETFQKYASRHTAESRAALTEPSKRTELLEKIPLFHEFCSNPSDASVFWNSEYQEQASFAFLVGDFNRSTPVMKYDLITSFMTCVVLDLHETFAAISSRLERDGTFVLLEPYWWHPYLFFGSVGHFPYAFQRLDGVDVERYVRQFHDAEKEVLLERLKVFSHHWTLNDYVKIADMHGLELIGERRFLQTNHFGQFRSKISPQAMNLHDDARLSDVLQDIHEFRNDVQFVDLLTSFVVLVFRKSEAGKNRLTETLVAPHIQAR